MEYEGLHHQGVLRGELIGSGVTEQRELRTGGEMCLGPREPGLLNLSKFHQKVRRRPSEKEVRVFFLKSASFIIPILRSKLSICYV